MTDKFDDRSYQQKISEYDWDDLLNFWKSIESGNIPGWQPGEALEYLVLRAFQLEGATVRWPYYVTFNEEQIEQIDGAVYSDGLSCLIECKNTTKSIKVEPIAKLRNQLLRRPSAAVGLFFSRSGFTKSATSVVQFMAPQTILLWAGYEIAYALENKSMRRTLVAKYRRCIEEGLPDYDITYKEPV
ncbi:MAG: restriction endonuclease [Ardenticatenaceae bacterium]